MSLFWDDLAKDLEDPEFRRAYEEAAEEIAQLHARMDRDNRARHALEDVAAEFGVDLDGAA
ncbi:MULTISPECIES: hypothetical protein [Nocardia]|uniref:hypothetical protein n=1 Tax=Nocardia TaxID=1817 RepID=UPI000D697680|nr:MULTISPECIES: hypothetical protein [Nocardia]